MVFSIRGEVAYAATGNKPIDPALETVVFVHGVGQDHTIWVLPTRYFARHDRNVLAVDLPGHGRSGGSPLTSIEEMADWIVEVMDEAGVDRAAVVGHSMGSLVALDLAGRYPSRSRAIAMVGVSVPLAVADALLMSSAENSHDAVDMLTYWGHAKSAQIGGSPTPGLWMVGGSMRLWEQAGEDVIHIDLKACNEYATGLEVAGSVECPALLLLGERDVMTPIRIAEVLRDHVSDGRMVVFENAGHALLSERSDPVLDELITVV